MFFPDSQDMAHGPDQFVAIQRVKMKICYAVVDQAVTVLRSHGCRYYVKYIPVVRDMTEQLKNVFRNGRATIIKSNRVNTSIDYSSDLLQPQTPAGLKLKGNIPMGRLAHCDFPGLGPGKAILGAQSDIVPDGVVVPAEFLQNRNCGGSPRDFRVEIRQCYSIIFRGCTNIG